METSSASFTSSSPQIQRLAEIVMYLQRNFLVSITEKVMEKKISIPQYTLLGFLSVNESLNMGKLASLMGHTTPATTGLVDRLTQAGLVERFAIPTDRRQVMVRITSKGRSLVEEVKSEIAQCLANIMNTLQASDREAWPRIYENMMSYCSQKSEK